jgi:S-adenosylmethionine decarboxylase
LIKGPCGRKLGNPGPALRVSFLIMPGKLAPIRHADIPPQATQARKLLWTVDGSPAAGSPVSGIAELTAAATAAVRAGDGHVLDTSHVIFPNGAVTLVLILAESHLAIHTWPEENLVAVDLFTCGAIDAGRVVTELITGLRLANTRVQQVQRGTARR